MKIELNFTKKAKLSKNALANDKQGQQSRKTYQTYLIICNLACLYLSLHISQFLYPLKKVETNLGHLSSSKGDVVQKVSLFEAIIKGVEHMTSEPLALFPVSIKFLIPYLIMFALCAMVLLAMYYKEKLYQTSLPLNEIQGSAKFFEDIPKNYNPKFVAPYEPGNPEKYPFDPNIIIADGLKMNLNNKAVNRNMNTLVIGGPGTGKSFNVIKPNLAQMNCSTITTDPSGELMMACAKAQMDRGIRIKLFSTSDMKHSNRYNPFDYIYDENGNPDDTKISTLIYLFLNNADGAKQKSGDQFWVKSAKALLTAIAYYLIEEYRYANPEMINFTQVLEMVQKGKVEDGPNAGKSELDKLMDAAEKKAEEQGRISKAVSNYATFKLATEKTANSILITCAVDLQLFSNDDVRILTSTDLDDDRNNLHLEQLGYEQTALYINIPQANGTFNFLVSMLYSQLFDALYSHAEKICPNRWLLMSEKNYPVLAGFKTEEEARKVQADLKDAEIKIKKNKHGGVYYQLVKGKKVLATSSSEYGAEQIKKLSQTARVMKGSEQGDTRLPWHVRCMMDEFANSVTRSTPKTVGITDKSVA